MKIILLTSSNDKMPRGKYKGQSILSIIQNDTLYATWMITNMKGVQFSKAISTDLKTWKFLSQ
jgi:uncharacterized protein (DUF3820 family)